MDERARGLILRLYPLTETSLIVHWLTPELGRLATAAKGARRPKSPFRGKLDLFYLADFSFSRSRSSDLHQLREVGLCETHEALRRDLDLLRQVSYCAKLIEQTTETETPLPEIFQLMRTMLNPPTDRPHPAHAMFAFELKLLRQLGLEPDSSKAGMSPGARQILRLLTDGEWAAIWRLELSPAQAAELRQFLHGFLIFHLGKIPSSRAGALRGDEDQ